MGDFGCGLLSSSKRIVLSSSNRGSVKWLRGQVSRSRQDHEANLKHNFLTRISAQISVTGEKAHKTFYQNEIEPRESKTSFELIDGGLLDCFLAISKRK